MSIDIEVKMCHDSIEFICRTFDIGHKFGASVRPVCSGVQELVLRTLQTRAPTMFREVECGIELIFTTVEPACKVHG